METNSLFKSMLVTTIIFDSNYVEPAIVTAYELCKFSNDIKKIILIFINSKKEEDASALKLATEFCQFARKYIPIDIIQVENSLEPYQAYHFNNSIIYKALIPSIVPNEEFVLNIDAGVLPGAEFSNLLVKINSLCKPNSNWIIGANCESASLHLSPPLSSLQHNPLYPSGIILLFNIREYFSANWHSRFIEKYLLLKESLVLAEQDLICITAEDNELIELPDSSRHKILHLGDKSLKGEAPTLDNTTFQDCTFYKIVGSFKPWNYWVLDPNKALYTSRRADMELEFKISGHPLIEVKRNKSIREEWPLQFYNLYDHYILRNFNLIK